MPVLVRDMWTGAGGPGIFGIRAVEQSLRARGRDFASSYAQFADANLRPRTTYVEGGRSGTPPRRPGSTAPSAPQPAARSAWTT